MIKEKNYRLYKSKYKIKKNKLLLLLFKYKM